MSGLPKVLVVEDKKMLQRALAMRFAGKADLLPAHNLAEARELFLAYRDDLRLVVLDGCLRSAFQVQAPDTLPLIAEFRGTFQGPIIAASTISSFRRMMVEAGCSHECDKDELPGEIERLLAGG